MRFYCTVKINTHFVECGVDWTTFFLDSLVVGVVLFSFAFLARGKTAGGLGERYNKLSQIMQTNHLQLDLQIHWGGYFASLAFYRPHH